ncbi:MAG: head-tail connector protein [Actinomycetota bacterium]
MPAARSCSMLEATMSTCSRSQRRLVLKGAVPTVAARAVNAFEIAFTAGYGGAADDVPGPIKQALKLLVAHWFERRRRSCSASARRRCRRRLRYFLLPIAGCGCDRVQPERSPPSPSCSRSSSA